MTARFSGDQEEVHVTVILLSGYLDGISFPFISEDINANLVLPLNLFIVLARDWELNTGVIQILDVFPIRRSDSLRISLLGF